MADRQADNGNLELPDGWAWTTIGEITQPVEKITPESNPETPFTYLDISSIDNSTNKVTEPKIYYGREAPSRARQLVRGNDVLFSTVRTYLKNIALVPENFDGQVASTGFSVLRGKKGISSKYLFYFTLTAEFLTALEQLQRGTSYPAVRDGDVREQFIPLAPTLEQERIVAAIESLFTQLDAGIAALKRVQANLRRYKAAVLKAACEGRLVPQDPNDEPASELLKRILAERRAKWETDLRAKEKDPKKAKYEEPASPDTEGLPELPESWAWILLGQLAWSVKDGPHYSPEYVDSGIPFITGGNVRPSGVDFEAAKRIAPELHHELSKRCNPEKGDILYTKGGTTGIARVNTYDHEFSVWVHVAVLKLVDSVEPFYVQHALNSPLCYAQAQRFTHGVGNQDLGLTRMVNIILSLPPLNEQSQIVSEIEKIMSIVNELETLVADNHKRAEYLRQSILKRAFEGKLVPQDPSDEPARVLLERVRAERASHDRPSKRIQKARNSDEQPRLI